MEGQEAEQDHGCQALQPVTRIAAGMRFLNGELQFIPAQYAQPKGDVNGEGHENQTDPKTRQRGSKAMRETGHQIEQGGPKTERADDELQKKDRAENESCESEPLARQVVAAARAAALIIRRAKLHRKQITGGRKVRVPPGVATAAALAAIAQREFLRQIVGRIHQPYLRRICHANQPQAQIPRCP
ncbi:MAG: hypothetical protein ABSA47_03775 [Verrucomicrobiota bacterium]